MAHAEHLGQIVHCLCNCGKELVVITHLRDGRHVPFISLIPRAVHVPNKKIFYTFLPKKWIFFSELVISEGNQKYTARTSHGTMPLIPVL